jgi:hypothetical protein
MSTPRYMQTGVPHDSVLSPTLYNLYINDTLKTRCTPSSPCRRYLSICNRTQGWLCPEKTKGLIKLNGGLVLVLEYRYQQRQDWGDLLFPPDSLLTLNGRDISFVNNVKHLSVILDKNITRRLHTQKRSKPKLSERSLEYILYSNVSD